MDMVPIIMVNLKRITDAMKRKEIDAHLFCFLICMYVLVSAKGEICGEVSPCFCWCRYLLRPNIEPDLSQFKPGSIHNANIVQFKWTNTPNIN